MTATEPARGVVDSGYAWARLAAAVALSAFGGVGMWSVVVALPTVQAEFGAWRAAKRRCRTRCRWSASRSAA